MKTTDRGKKTSLMVQVLAGVLLLLAGIAIYLLFRSQTIVLYQWCMHLGLADVLTPLRQQVQSWTVPDFARYSLPDGMYCASYILLMDALWRNSGRVMRLCFTLLIPVCAILHELLQAASLVRGTFDVADLLCYATPLLVYLLIIHKKASPPA